LGLDLITGIDYIGDITISLILLMSMKSLIIATALIFLTSAPVHAGDEWDTVDKALFGSVIGSKVIDCLQTTYIYESDRYHERHNLFIEKGVDSFGKLFIPVYFATEITAAYIFSNDLSSAYRKAALGLVLGSSLFMIENNASIGIGFALPF